MALVRGSIRGYEDDRMVLLFSMMDDAREVPCAVSASAMDDMDHVAGTPADRREEQFVRLRDRIEACAARSRTHLQKCRHVQSFYIGHSSGWAGRTCVLHSFPSLKAPRISMRPHDLLHAAASTKRARLP
jgi:hypothetical protein